MKIKEIITKAINSKETLAWKDNYIDDFHLLVKSLKFSDYDFFPEIPITISDYENLSKLSFLSKIHSISILDLEFLGYKEFSILKLVMLDNKPSSIIGSYITVDECNSPFRIDIENDDGYMYINDLIYFVRYIYRTDYKEDPIRIMHFKYEDNLDEVFF